MAYEILTTPENEVLEYSASCDLWSIGIVYYMLLYGKPPFNGITQQDLINNII